jgi:hypothetical protein
MGLFEILGEDTNCGELHGCAVVHTIKTSVVRKLGESGIIYLRIARESCSDKLLIWGYPGSRDIQDARAIRKYTIPDSPSFLTTEVFMVWTTAQPWSSPQFDGYFNSAYYGVFSEEWANKRDPSGT